MSHGFDNAYVGLMRYNPSNVVVCKVVTLGYLCASVAHIGYGKLKHGASLLVEVVHAVVDGEVRRTANATACFHAEEGKSLTISAQVAVLPA